MRRRLGTLEPHSNRRREQPPPSAPYDRALTVATSGRRCAPPPPAAPPPGPPSSRATVPVELPWRGVAEAGATRFTEGMDRHTRTPPRPVAFAPGLRDAHALLLPATRTGRPTAAHGHGPAPPAPPCWAIRLGSGVLGTGSTGSLSQAVRRRFV